MRLSKPSVNFQRVIRNKKVTRLLLVSGIGLFLVAGVVLVTTRVQKPETVFWEAISNAAEVRSISAQFTATSQDTTEFTYRYSNGPTPSIELITKSYGSGDRQVPEVISHNVGTPTTNYERFVKYRPASATAGPEQFAAVENVWAEQTLAGPDAETLIYNQFLNSFSIYFPVLYASLGDTEREEMMRILKDEAITVDYDKSRRITSDGRPAYGFIVSIDFPSYIRVLQTYGKSIDYPYFDALNPNDAVGAEPIEIELVVDVASRQITALKNQGIVVRYEAHGARVPVNAIPRGEVTPEELRKRQESIQ